jgi:hypothetical protein
MVKIERIIVKLKVKGAFLSPNIPITIISMSTNNKKKSFIKKCNKNKNITSPITKIKDFK